MAFPPVPLFPNSIDSDYTLYLVHNTTESRLCTDNSAWADEINILPVSIDKPEIWATNGFGNIEGELFYYDSVEYDNNGKINKLKGCARNLTGKTKFNSKGTWVRGFVVAEHHNQLVDAVLKIEDFIGYNFDPRIETLDWRIRNLQKLNIIFDDFNCPDINFIWNIVENSNETGILATYTITITPPGTINSFRLDFGDGTFTTTDFSGNHRYALNANIDPIVTVANDKCTMIQTPAIRENPSEPPQIVTQVFDFALPNSLGAFPEFTLVPFVAPETQILMPPITYPCLSIEGQSSTTPPIIIGPDINMVSNVVIEGPSNPVQILYSVVTIEGGFSLPSTIFVDMPPTIVIDPPIPPTIVVVTQSNITMGLDFASIPMIQVDWGAPPPMEVQMTMAREVKSSAMLSAQSDELKNEFGDEFADLFQADNHIKVEYEPVGFPSEIKIIAPELKIDASDIPDTIKIEIMDANIPKNIQIFGPETPIPSTVQILGPAKPLPDEIRMICDDIPKEIPLVYSGATEFTIEHKITIEMPKPIPDTIFIDASGIPSSIQVVGIPETIRVTGFPEGIPVIFPKAEDMPKIELIYNGGAIPMQLTMDKMLSTSEDGTVNCVTISRCPR